MLIQESFPSYADRATRMATAGVLLDLGPMGKQAVQARIAAATDVSKRIMLQESLEAASKPDYRPILQYPLSDSERIRVHGCHSNVTLESHDRCCNSALWITTTFRLP